MPRPLSLVQFILSSAVLVCLGWGLRGYIGGGPLGAMIPGAFLALWLCLLLDIEGRRAAIIAAFSAAGIGIGGEMTYGQTLGFLRDADTVAWGLTGTVVKGGAWGLLGGAILGFGFIAHKLPFRQVAIAYGVLLAAIFLGIALVNHPKLIYFSDPLNKPRAEVWAGLLFGALALLGYLRSIGQVGVPLRFALFGLAGGAAGFGIGGVEMAIGNSLEQPLKSLPWWKFMEFTFGALLGGALGACAWTLRDTLREEPKDDQAPSSPPLLPMVGIALLAMFALVSWNYTAEGLIETVYAWPAAAVVIPLALVLLGYSTFASAFALASLRSETLAWQFAITLTFAATVVDLTDDFGPESGLQTSALFRGSLLLAATALCAGLVIAWQRAQTLSLRVPLFGLMWACMAVAYARILVTPEVILGEDGSLLERLLLAFFSHGLVHDIFLGCAIYMTLALVVFGYVQVEEEEAAA